jgi:hypothetical protein
MCAVLKNWARIWRKARILFEPHLHCQTFLSILADQDKKNATRKSRVKSTPKEEGGGDKAEPGNHKIIRVRSVVILDKAKNKNKGDLCLATISFLQHHMNKLSTLNN